jgi:hypothetical protein
MTNDKESRMKTIQGVRTTLAGLAGLIAMAVACHAAAAGGTAKGTLTYKSKSGVITMTPKFAYLVKGPDAVDPGKVIRHLIFSPTDLGAKIEACTTMSCTDSGLGSGLTVDLDAGPRLNYWVVLNDQRVQYSGTEPPAALSLTTNTPARLAGKLVFDGAAMGGPQVDIEFDVPLMKELTKAR